MFEVSDHLYVVRNIESQWLKLFLNRDRGLNIYTIRYNEAAVL
jgi:hypothetical protein